jgi:hypothetical protein
MAFGEHWEWRGFGDLSAPTRDKILQLTPKYGAGITMLDQYLWAPGCTVNVKIRQQDLKFKYLQSTAPEGFEQWKEDEKDNYPFPLNRTVLAQLEQALCIQLPPAMTSPTVDTAQSLLNMLQQATPPVACVAIEKFRNTYVYLFGGTEILVELADIKNIDINGQQEAKTLTSVSLEGEDLDLVRRTRDALGLPDLLQVKGYMQLIKEMVP